MTRTQRLSRMHSSTSIMTPWIIQNPLLRRLISSPFRLSNLLCLHLRELTTLCPRNQLIPGNMNLVIWDLVVSNSPSSMSHQGKKTSRGITWQRKINHILTRWIRIKICRLMIGAYNNWVLSPQVISEHLCCENCMHMATNNCKF